MKILVLYATYSSGTQMAASLVAESLSKQYPDVLVMDISEITPETLTENDLIIMGSPSWDFNDTTGMPHQYFIDFIEKMKGKKFPDKKFAVFGLGDKSYPHFCGAVDHLEQFVKDMQGKLVVPSLRIDGYFFNQDEANTQIATWVDSLLMAIK